MTNMEIAEAVRRNHKLIEVEMNPGQFTLNARVKKLLDENSELQKLCTHNFDSDNVCVYCNYLAD